MPAPAVKVELGLDLGDNSPQGFTLDDAIKGVLDNTSFILGGELFYDITDRLTSVSVKRGKSQALDRIDAGIADITLNNNDREFDPLYPDSLYYGFLVPRKKVRITANDKPVFFGFIEDLDLNYLPQNRSSVSISVADALSQFTNTGIEDYTPVSQLSGARVNAVLDLPTIGWSSTERRIDDGNSIMLDADVADGTGALDYLKLVALSEQGNFFIGKDGAVVFQERNTATNAVDLIFTDDLTPSAFTKIPFSRVTNVYGSENLYNQITVSNADTIPDEVYLEDEASIGAYGARAYSVTNVLIQDPDELEDMATRLLFTYSEPLYRFDSITVELDRLSTVNQNAVLDLEIGDIVQVEFTPNGIPPAISLACRILGISQQWGVDKKQILFSLETLNYGVFVLNSDLFGQLDNDRLGY
jgi:hypothetical protein